MAGTDARSVAAAYMDRINAKDVEGLLDLFADDCVLQPPTGTTERGKEAARAFYGGLVIPAGITMHPSRYVAEGSSCAVELEARRDGAEPMRIIDVFTVDDDGRITDLVVYQR
jgi:steroid Delta-isomerase